MPALPSFWACLAGRGGRSLLTLPTWGARGCRRITQGASFLSAAGPSSLTSRDPHSLTSNGGCNSALPPIQRTDAGRATTSGLGRGYFSMQTRVPKPPHRGFARTRSRCWKRKRPRAPSSVGAGPGVIPAESWAFCLRCPDNAQSRPEQLLLVPGCLTFCREGGCGSARLTCVTHDSFRGR